MNKFKSLSKKDKAEYIAIVALYPFFKLFSWLGKSLKLFGTKKRQITASVLTFALIMTMLPTMSFTAFAATPTTEVYVGSVVMNATNQYAKTDADGKVTLGGSESDYNVKFDSTTGTLTLKNAIINESFVQGSYKSVIHCASDLKLILTDGTVNTITESNTEKERFSIAIYVGLSLAISGGGMLTVTGGETNGNSIGIASNSTLTIDGGTIIATAGDAQSYSYGILSQNEDIVINGGTVVGVGGNANRNASYGIDSLSKSIIINGGTVTGTGGKASISVGIISEGKVSITINGGTVTANSTSTTGTITAMNMAPDLSAYTPPVPTVTASTDTNGSSPVSYNASDIATYKYLKIEPSTYTVVGNGDMFGGDWDATNDSNNMVYDATLGKYVKVFDNIKQGDYEFKITLNNSWVTSWGDSSRPTGSAVAKVTKDGMSVKIIFDPTSEEIDTEIYMPDTAAHPTSWSELQTAINAGGEIKLTQNIVAESTDDQLNVPSTSTVTIDLNGYKIDRNLTTAVDNGSVFYINRGNLTINDTSASKTGQITGGKTTGNGGGVYINSGTFTMRGGSITGNTSGYGGGVYISSSGTFTMSDGSITGNTVDTGGGVYIYKGAFTMSGGSITDNTARYGGGVNNFSGTFTMNGGSITDNTARYCGGVFNYSGTFTMNGGSITDNTAEDGGGVYNSDTFKVSGSAIVKDNKKTDDTTSNVYLPSGKYITVTGALSGEIGVTTKNSPTATAPITITQVSTNSEYTLTANDVAKLKSDVDGYEVVKSGDVAVLQKTLGTLTASNFNFNAPTDTTYSGTTKAATVTANSGVSCGTITIKYYDANGTVVEGPTNVGKYIVKIDVAANDNYSAITGLEVGSFTITAKELTLFDLTIVSTKHNIYTGSAIKPALSVSCESATLLENTDYTLSYGTNTDIGKGSVTINFKGNYSGSAEYEIFINYGTATTAMYSVNPPVNDWYNNNITVSAASGYTISKTATGFASSITLDTEVQNGTQEIYLKATDGKVYKGSFSYKLDKTAPADVKIQYNNSGFKSFLNTITFGLFFKETVKVEAAATDALSGIDTIQYYAADSAVADTSKITDWDSSLSLKQNSKKVVYIKVTDKAGNATITNNEGVVCYTDSTVTPTTAAFDLNAAAQADVAITMTLNDNTLREVKNGTAVLTKDTDYTVSGNTVTVKKSYLSAFANGTQQTLTLVFNPMGVAGDTVSTATAVISITDTTHTHSGTHHARVEATCTADGNVEYWSCSCGKNFSNSTCTTPITEIILTKLGHNATATAEKAATCTEDGNSAYWYCSTCKKYFSNASCTTETALTNTVIAKLGHSFGTPTYDWNGDKCTAQRACTASGCSEKETEIVTASTVVTQQKSCTLDELSTYTASFKNNAFATQTQTKVKTADKLGHSFGTPDYSWSGDKCTAQRACTVSGCTEKETEIVTASATVTQQKSCTLDELSTYTASFKNNAFAAQTQTKVKTADKLGHSFTSYVSDNNATYFKDGTETAKCDRCDVTDTRTAAGSKLIDNTAPTASMTIGTNTWNSLLNNITFGLFFKETQTVTVTANDNESGIDKTYYYLANSETTDFTGISWTEFKDSFNISPNNKYVVYVKVTDKFGNKVIINSDGIVLEDVVPQMSAENGKTYCAAIEITVTDDNLDTVTLNDDKVTLINGKFTVSPKSGTQTIVATDKAGNKTTVTITVNDGHTWDEGKVTTEPTAANEGVRTYTCTVCGETKTEAIAKLAPTMTDGANGKFTQGGKDGLIFKSDAALSDLESVSVDGNVIDTDKYTTAEGSTVVTLTANYLNTLTVGKHTLDIKSASGIASTEFTIEAKTTNTPKPTDPTKPGDTTSPQTGDNSNMVLWICLLFVSGGVLTTLGLAGKKRRKQNEK